MAPVFPFHSFSYKLSMFYPHLSINFLSSNVNCVHSSSFLCFLYISQQLFLFHPLVFSSVILLRSPRHDTAIPSFSTHFSTDPISITLIILPFSLSHRHCNSFYSFVFLQSFTNYLCLNFISPSFTLSPTSIPPTIPSHFFFISHRNNSCFFLILLLFCLAPTAIPPVLLVFLFFLKSSINSSWFILIFISVFFLIPSQLQQFFLV